MEETRGSSAPQPLNEQVSDWTLQVIKALRARLGIRIQVHREGRELQDGKIFLFNHFARFETFIPQSIIREETGAFCRSVASRELFKKDTLFSSYLLSIGAVPNNYERLLPFLAEEILRGRKVIVFPEGGMVKDRKVFGDSTEQYLIYSRSARERRPHHSGPAVLSLTLDAFKVGLSELLRQGNRAELNRWADKLAMSPEILEKAIQEPTLVVPSNITFHPIRVDQNILSRGAELLGHDINPQLAEELLIEGNLLFRETDMDIR
ncbi:MAG: alpha/beta hydrolase, partial [Rhodospirillales bacterium]